MGRLDTMRANTAKYDWVPYYAAGGDNDHDGTPDRADFNDGNGVDCSGWVWASFAMAWAPSPPPFPLTSSAGFALMGLHNGWLVSLRNVQPGDIVVHDKYGNPYESNGPRGHTGWVSTVNADGTWTTSESASSSNGVGFYTRPRSFWSLALRVPGLHDKDAPAFTPEQLTALIRAMEELDVEHGQAVDFALNPANPTQGYTLERWGSISPFGGLAKPTGGPYWPGQDVARRIHVTNWSKGQGYVMDLNGGLHPFGGAPRLSGTAYWSHGKIVAFNEA